MTASTPLGWLLIDREVTGSVLLSLRPEHLALGEPGSSPNALQGHVLWREFKGHDITFTVEVDGSQYLAHTTNRIGFQPGDDVELYPIDPAIVLVGANHNRRRAYPF